MHRSGSVGLIDGVSPNGRFTADRLLARFASARKNFHLGGSDDWSVSPETIRFLAAHLPVQAASLETGSGLSTVFFAALGGRHVCICPDRSEQARVIAYCAEIGVAVDGVNFVNELSEAALPVLETPPLDLVLIDGGHGFPMPIIDWYFTAGKLKLGGILVVDDTHLWTSQVLVDFLKHDSAWTSLGRIGRRTFAFRKEGPFEYKEFCFQPYVVQKSRFRSLVTRGLTAWDMLSTLQFGEVWRRAQGFSRETVEHVRRGPFLATATHHGLLSTRTRTSSRPPHTMAPNLD